MKAVIRKDLQGGMSIPAVKETGTTCWISFDAPVEVLQAEDKAAIKVGGQLYIVDTIDLDFVES